jgi:hypothetical protein
VTVPLVFLGAAGTVDWVVLGWARGGYSLVNQEEGDEERGFSWTSASGSGFGRGDGGLPSWWTRFMEETDRQAGPA